MAWKIRRITTRLFNKAGTKLTKNKRINYIISKNGRYVAESNRRTSAEKYVKYHRR